MTDSDGPGRPGYGVMWLGQVQHWHGPRLRTHSVSRLKKAVIPQLYWDRHPRPQSELHLLKLYKNEE